VTAGGRRYRLDLAYAGARVAVELDGRGHDTEASFESDRARDSRLAAAGWVVHRVTWRRFVAEPGEIAGEIAAALAHRSRTGARNERATQDPRASSG
jgi:very-short-patch-repair endonuclease